MSTLSYTDPHSGVMTANIHARVPGPPFHYTNIYNLYTSNSCPEVQLQHFCSVKITETFGWWYKLTRLHAGL